MIDRIFKSWRNTVIGLLILLLPLALVFTGKSTLTEAAAFISTLLGIFFVFKKDSDADGDQASAG